MHVALSVLTSEPNFRWSGPSASIKLPHVRKGVYEREERAVELAARKIEQRGCRWRVSPKTRVKKVFSPENCHFQRPVNSKASFSAERI